MRVHGLCLVRDEADIVREHLESASAWCDRIYVYDNGSEDGTWDIVREVARACPQVVPFASERRPFSDGLRAALFNAFRERARPGDWWCRLDADEFYVGDPRSVLRRAPRRCHVVWAIHLQYYLTELSLTGDARTGASVTERCRHYLAEASEPRFFRHRPRLRWDGGAWPRHLGLVAPERVLVRHFQYRSPEQARRRLALRRHSAHWSRFEDWRDTVRDSSGLHLDRHDGRFEVDESRLPRHLEPAWQRAVKGLMHATGLWP